MCLVLSCVWLFATPRTVAHQAPLSMGFPRQEYWSGLPFPPPGDLAGPGIKPVSPALQADSLPLSHWERCDAGYIESQLRSREEACKKYGWKRRKEETGREGDRGLILAFLQTLLQSLSSSRPLLLAPGCPCPFSPCSALLLHITQTGADQYTFLWSTRKGDF